MITSELRISSIKLWRDAWVAGIVFVLPRSFDAIAPYFAAIGLSISASSSQLLWMQDVLIEGS